MHVFKELRLKEIFCMFMLNQLEVTVSKWIAKNPTAAFRHAKQADSGLRDDIVQDVLSMASFGQKMQTPENSILGM